MSRIKYKSNGGPTPKDFRERGFSDRPEKPNPGDVHQDKNGLLVYTGRDWAWFPETASDLIRFARSHRWGTRVEIAPKYTPGGFNAEGDKLIRTDVKIVLLIGREPGASVGGRPSKGYTYRLVWDTSRNGLFELVSWHRRTSTHTSWAEVGSISEIRPIIARNPVLPERTEIDA